MGTSQVAIQSTSTASGRLGWYPPLWMFCVWTDANMFLWIEDRGSGVPQWLPTRPTRRGIIQHFIFGCEFGSGFFRAKAFQRSSVPPNWACHLNHLSTFGLSDCSKNTAPSGGPASSRGLAQRHLVDAFSLPLLCPKFCHQLVEEVKHFRDWREAAKQISPGGFFWAIWEKVCWKRWWDVLDDSFNMFLYVFICFYGIHFFCWIHHDTPKSKVTMESDALQIVDDYNL